jgi:hypothetical protein
MCFVFISQQTATFALCNINWLVFIIEIKSVYCAVRTGCFNKRVPASSLKGSLFIKWRSQLPRWRIGREVIELLGGIIPEFVWRDWESLPETCPDSEAFVHELNTGPPVYSVILAQRQCSVFLSYLDRNILLRNNWIRSKPYLEIS